MHVFIPQIKWHGVHSNQPIQALDFHPTQSNRVVTAGSDRNLIIWEIQEDKLDKTTRNSEEKVYLKIEEGALQFISCLSALNENQILTVRWHPVTGHIIASGHSSGLILIWKQQTNTSLVKNDDNLENWKDVRQLRNAAIQGDIYDLQWCVPNETITTSNNLTFPYFSRYIISASLDSKIVVWDIETGNALHVIEEHRLQPVQGIAVDPLGRFFASQSADRSVLVFDCKDFTVKKLKSIAQIKYLTEEEKQDTDVMMVDEEQQSATIVTPVIKKRYLFKKQENDLYRKLAFSPDGSFLITTGGLDVQHKSEHANTAYVFARNNWITPVCHLPGHKYPVIAVSFCPRLFSLRKLEPLQQETLFQCNLPYRMLFALLTCKSIVIYDTHNPTPIAYYEGLHFATMNELKWSNDGKFIIVVSDDGFCTVIKFSEQELGEPIHISETENDIALHPHLSSKLKQQQTIQKNYQAFLQQPKNSLPSTPVIHTLTVKRKV